MNSMISGVLIIKKKDDQPAHFGHSTSFVFRDRRHKTEDTRQKTEDTRQKTQDRRLKTEATRHKTED